MSEYPEVHRLYVAVQTPLHSHVGEPLTYVHHAILPPGTLVRVPLGTREVLGVVWDAPRTEPALPAHAQLRPIVGTVPVAPMDASWQRMVAFAARYYQRSLGEIAMAGLPPALRTQTQAQIIKRLNRYQPQPAKRTKPSPPSPKVDPSLASQDLVTLSAEQRDVCTRIEQQPGPFLLYGNTGSGKTEVYLRMVQHVLQTDPGAQALILVPEINLTPQLEARFHERFTPIWGSDAVVSLHSGLTDVQRLKHWLAAHTGHARVVLGTRMAVLSSLPKLRMIVVDEEHDPSYKQEDGARYHARDLALWRGHDAGAKVILGSATPSLESWHASCSETGTPQRLQRLDMPSRIGAAALPAVRLVNMGQQPKKTIFSQPLLQAITERIQRGEQSLILLNRRGFAPVLFCGDCGWKSDCPHCSAHQVFHKNDRTLRCHHCGYTQRVPQTCPSCGNPDIMPLGQGTQQLHEELERHLRNVQRPDGQPASIARIDADTTRHKGSLQTQLEAIHRGEVDVLVGTQMIAKGHDFRRITLVAAAQPDGALFSSDFRAPERLFSLLLQAAGRAGRDAHYIATQGSRAEMWIQTSQPQHPVFEALRRHDFPAFATNQLREREEAAMPPFVFQALVRADAKTQEAAQAFLRAASDVTKHADLPHQHDIFLYPPIPLSVQRIANVERAQMLVEAPSRKVLQKFLQAWLPWLHWVRSHPEHKPLIRWLVDVDPLSL